MPKYTAPSQVNIGDSGPPPNANFHPAGKHQNLQGEGSPEGRVMGNIGDDYTDTSTGDEWKKLSDNGFSSGWELESGGGSSTDLQDFAVVPDAPGDQTSLIQNAINVAIARGVTLTSPAGTFRLGQITIDGRLRWQGQGKDITIFKSSISLNSTSGLINVSADSHVHFEDLSFDGNYTVNRVVRVNQNCDSIFRNCRIRGAYGSLSVTATTCGLIVGGGGSFRFLDSDVLDCIAEPDGDNTGNIPGTVRGITVTTLDSEEPPSSVVISRSTFGNILSGDADSERNEDADAISYQGFAQTSKGNVTISNCKFYNIGKRWVKALSPGGMIINCDGTNDSPSTRPMFSLFSINTSDWLVQGNRCYTGASSFFCDIGNPGTWACSGVTVTGNIYSQGADPNTSGQGCRVMGGSSTLTTGVVISGNQFRAINIGVQVAGGTVGVRVTANYIEATETGVHIGHRYSGEEAHPDANFPNVGENIGTATNYGIRWRLMTNATTGLNYIESADPLICEPADPSSVFVNAELFNLQIIGGSLKNASLVVAGHTTAGIFGADTPKVQSISTSGLSAVAAETRDGTRNTRAILFVNDTGGISTWGLDSTFSAGGEKTFQVRQADTVWFSCSGTNFTFSVHAIPSTGGAFDLGTSVVDFRSGYLRTNLHLGKPSIGTGTLILSHADTALSTSLRQASAPASAVTYVWPADDPAPGDALRVTSFTGGVATLEWSP